MKVPYKWKTNLEQNRDKPNTTRFEFSSINENRTLGDHVRIAIVSSTFEKRHRLRLSFLRALRKAGHRCKLFGISFTGRQVDFPQEATVISQIQTKANMFSRKWHMPAFRQAIINDVLEFQPECIICTDPETLFVGVYCKKNYGCRIVYAIQEFHGHTTHATQVSRLWVNRTERNAVACIDIILVISDSMKQHMRQKLTHAPPIEIISNAYAQDFLPSQYCGYLHEQAGNLAPETKILLYHGYLAEHRGLLWLAEFSRLLPKQWHTVFMGWGPLETRLKQHNSTHMSVIAPVEADRLPHVISGADIGVIPYDPINLNHKNSTPNKLYEYCAAGVPVLTENLPLIAREIRTYDMGWVLEKSGPIKEWLSIFDIKNKGEIDRKAKNCQAFNTAHKGRPDLVSFITGHPTPCVVEEVDRIESAPLSDTES